MPDNASFEFHPAARDAINQGANDLLCEFAEHVLKPNPPPAFRDGGPPKDMHGQFAVTLTVRPGRGYEHGYLVDEAGYRDAEV
jgi:hypothetical protein